MEKYSNKSGDSGITHYKIGKDYITILFKNKLDKYIYSTAKIDKKHITKMKQLALSGKGLSSYISQHPEVKENYIKG